MNEFDAAVHAVRELLRKHTILQGMHVTIEPNDVVTWSGALNETIITVVAAE